MNKKPRPDLGSNHEQPHNRSPVGRSSELAAGEDRRRTSGEMDAVPSNTASNSCIGHFFRPLRWGVDSLYLSFQGDLFRGVEQRLNDLKAVAQSSESHEQAFAQYEAGAHVFEVRDKGAGMFPYVLDDNAYRLQFSRSGKKLPMAYAKVSSEYLCHKSAQDIESELRALLEEFGEITDSANVSRIDLYVDFVSSVDMESWTRSAWVTRASSVNAYSVGGRFSGWTVGLGGVIACRLYDKTLEIETSKKGYLRALWSEQGWTDDQKVWRLEFQFRREILDQKGIQKLYSVLSHLNGLWSYATTEWLRLTEPNPDDKTRARWPVHPLWIAVASVDWEDDGAPLSKRFSPLRAPSDDGLCKMAFSALTSFMARECLWDFNEAWHYLGNRLYDYHATRSHFQGIPFEQMLVERVRLKGRKFNTINNAAEIPHEDRIREGYDEVAREYRKQSRGG
ncbi:replication initiation factor [Nitrogeniibacter aestuarii]|uniref:replication initiation factor n=1 Tax=Nitrogeniibacter aestuarii TaxID=2815343 RepID=UPI001D101900|nr:replication initiation factor [Nitrogeniibacter aestuarii]